MENGEINKSVLNLTKKIITQIDSFIDGKFSNLGLVAIWPPRLSLSNTKTDFPFLKA